MKKLSRPWVFLFLLLIASSSQAANSLDVVINEIAWMGTSVSYNDEWIELYNTTDSLINLDGWFIIHFTQKGEQGSTFDLGGTIPAHGFYLLERTDDNSVPNITADKIYTGPLNNNGELLQLSDEQGTIIDLIDCIDGGWFAGDNKTKQTMERIGPDSLGSEPENWQTSQNPGGTPKAKNSVAIEASSEEQIIKPEPEPELLSQEEPQPKLITYPSGIVINEILPSPEGPDEEEEWIELFNQNDFEVDITGWQIQDIVGKTKIYTFLEGTKIASQGFLVLPRPESKITLNNDGDGLNLIQPDEKIVDTITYEKAPKGESYNRIDLKWIWSSILTPGVLNQIPSPKIEIEEKQPFVKISEKVSPQIQLATITKIIPKEGISFPSNFIAFLIAIFSGVIILILKKKVEKIKKID